MRALVLLYTGTQRVRPEYRGVEQLAARRAHNPEVGGSSPPPATIEEKLKDFSSFFVNISYHHAVFIKLF